MKLLIAITIVTIGLLASKWMSMTADTSVQTRVDTVHVVTTVYDTVRFSVSVGTLSQKDIVRLVCSNLAAAEPQQFALYGDQRDEFEFNAYGMVFCPKREN